MTLFNLHRQIPSNDLTKVTLHTNNRPLILSTLLIHELPITLHHIPMTLIQIMLQLISIQTHQQNQPTSIQIIFLNFAQNSPELIQITKNNRIRNLFQFDPYITNLYFQRLLIIFISF